MIILFNYFEFLLSQEAVATILVINKIAADNYKLLAYSKLWFQSQSSGPLSRSLNYLKLANEYCFRPASCFVGTT